jgi:hypothetical protein
MEIAIGLPNAVRQYVKEFESAGCDELFMFPASKDPAQVDLLADAVQPERAG